MDENNAYNFDTPQTVLLLPKDSLKSFFRNGDIIDNRTSFYATYNTINKNTYTFSNISNLITAMYKNKGKSEEVEQGGTRTYHHHYGNRELIYRYQ